MENIKGKLIVFDGLDGTGKQTQSTLLYDYLNHKNIKCKRIAFPVYESPSGRIVRQYLKGELNLDKNIYDNKFNDRYRKALLYAQDRYINLLKQDENNKSLMDYYNEGYIIICDRYVSSNYLFMTHGMVNYEYDKFVKTINMIEYELIGIPKPDLSFFLEMTPEKSLECINKRGEEKDIHETEDILREAYNSLILYKNYIKRNKTNNTAYINETIFINCIDESNSLRTIDNIHNEIVSIINSEIL